MDEGPAAAGAGRKMTAAPEAHKQSGDATWTASIVHPWGES
jgi:hypothetical protein